MRSNGRTRLFGLLFTLLIVTIACASLTARSGEPVRTKEQPFNGVTYIKEVHNGPNELVIHIVKINVAKGGIRPLVTPPDRPKSDQPYDARTTSEFAKKFKVQIAINGGGFRPWYDYKLIYSPHSGDKVSPLGTAISDTFQFNADEDQKLPLLLFGGARPVDIGYVASKANYAVSGTRMLVENGDLIEGLDDRQRAPRTTAGIDKQGHTLIIVIVDGRQAGYSQGVTLQEIAQILADNGAYRALELDGGGSSTLVLNQDGSPVVLNSPVHQGIPGKERPVATHIGFFIK